MLTFKNLGIDPKIIEEIKKVNAVQVRQEYQSKFLVEYGIDLS